LPFGITSTYFDNIKSNFTFYGDNSNASEIGKADLGGKFMYTLVNINYVASLMKKWRNSNTKGDVYFVDLVKDILDGISKATGGYNEFRLVPDDDTRCIRILDDRRTAGSGQPIPNYTEIPILGKKSIVYNFNYTSKIAPNTAAMIVIAAQAQPYGVQGAENALAFSHLNKGLYNRLGTVRVDSAKDLNENASTNDDVTQRYIELRDFIEGIYDAVGTGARSSTAAENAEREKELGVKKTSLGDFKKIPIENVKAFVLGKLNEVWDALRDKAKGLEDKGELNNMFKAVYGENGAKNTINSSTNEDIADNISNGLLESATEVLYTDEQLYNYIHTLLEDEYVSIGQGVFGTDTAIEAAWTALAEEQTGDYVRTWY
jgi:hypothetical protein